MRVAVIGCGFFAQNHLNGWRDLAAEDVQLVAVCDLDANKAEAAANAFGVPRFYTDAKTMLDNEQLDFVDIVTQMDSHLEMVKLACARRVDIILQKPLAPEWGAPLRLRIPTKLGFKSAKNLQAIEVTNAFPGGYWEKQGYDWFSGV